MPGDLLMTSAGDVGLKEFKQGELKRNELVFSIAKSFRYINYEFKYNNKKEDFVVKDL